MSEPTPASHPAPAAQLLRTLASAALREGDPAALADEAAGALGRVFQTQKNLVLDVQFTGFSFKGRMLGRVDPHLLKAAAQLITLRVTRVGFTPDVSGDALRVLYEAVGKTTADLAGEGVVGYLARHRPRGIYLSTSTGEVYRPPAPPKPEPAPAAEAPPSTIAAEAAPTIAPAVETPREEPGTPVAETVESPLTGTEAAPTLPAEVARGAALTAAMDLDAFGGDGTDLADFELLDEFPVLGSAAPAQGGGPDLGAPRAGEEPGSHDMYHFFRAVRSDRADEEAEKLPGLLRAAENPTTFDELAQAASRAALRLVRSDLHEQAVELLDALVAEAQRADRTRTFRDSAAQALRRVGTGETLHLLADLLQYGGVERERILTFFLFIGGEAVPLLETILFRTADPELRQAIFRRLLTVEGTGQRVLARAMSDPSASRTRAVLELAALPDVEPEMAARWFAEAATHPEPAVRTDAARLAAGVGGRGGLRVLLDLLNDRDPAVKRAAIQYLGTLGDAAAVPFLSRIVTDSGDEEMQVAAIGTLGRLGSGDALPALLSVVNRRALFGGKKMQRVKAAAVGAIGRIATPAAREVIASLASGGDSDVAAEARRILATIG